MAYHLAEIEAQLAREDEITSLLLICGAEGVSSESAQFRVHSIEAGLAEEWDEQELADDREDHTVTVTGYFPTDDRWGATAAHIEEGLGKLRRLYPHEEFRLLFRTLEDESWNEVWKQYYKPFRVGERLVIKPDWENYAAAADDVVVAIDPGLAFGTGDHPTTCGALRFLEQRVEEEMRVLDVGCGSGILSVAALLLGAERVTAMDYDREAVRATVHNARLNGVLDRIDVQQRDVLNDGFGHGRPFDLIVANIVASIIMELTPGAVSVLKPGGIFICGGVLREREAEVMDCLHDNGLSVAEIVEEGSWVTILAIR